MTTGDLQSRALERLNEDPVAPDFYTAIDILAALNLGQRIYAFLTLCLESIRPLQLTPGNQWIDLQTAFPDMIVVLRAALYLGPAGSNNSGFNQAEFDSVEFNEQAIVIPTVASPKLTAASVTEMAAVNNAWLSAAGVPSTYATLGFGLLIFDKSPDDAYGTLLKYARMPVALVNPTDVPEIPEPDHQALIDFAVGFLRIREGGQELQNDAPALGTFMDTVSRRAAQIRARSLAQRYDKAPPETVRFDVSRIIKARGAA